MNIYFYRSACINETVFELQRVLAPCAPLLLPRHSGISALRLSGSRTSYSGLLLQYGPVEGVIILKYLRATNDITL